MRRNKANDLQVLQIIQSRSGRTEGQERKQQCADGKPRRCSFDSIATHHSLSLTEPIRLSRLQPPVRRGTNPSGVRTCGQSTQALNNSLLLERPSGPWLQLYLTWFQTPSGPLSCGVDSDAECRLSLEAVFAPASATLLAAHLAFIAAASCARRSGERLSFRFAFLTRLDFFAPVGCAEDFFSTDGEGLGARRAAAARAADFLAAFIAFAASAACSFCLSLANFFGPSCRRFSSRRIFFFTFLSFIIVVQLATNAN